MLLPRKLKPAKMGIRPFLQTVWPRHRRWVRAHGCCVPGCPAARTEFAHLRSAANAGTGRKPHDAFGVSLCYAHHDEQHRVGAHSFSQKYQIDLWVLAAEFVRHSPDEAMRASLKLMPIRPSNRT
jgi:Putative HNHc nuclease